MDGVTAPIEITGLVKTFGSTRALDGLDLTVSEGEVHGFLGPNGAGKSTTIRVLLGLLRKDAGDVRLLGGDPWRQAASLHRRLAYVPGDVNLWPTLTGGEVIDLLGRLRGGLDERRRAELVERFELDPTKKCRSYSKGNRQKVALIAALASDVELLMLDEPTSGLDPLMESVFTDYVDAFREGGRTVLLSSHILAEVERLCDRVSIIRAGRRVETGTLAELRHLTRTSVVAELAGTSGRAGRARRGARPRRRGLPGPLPGRRQPARPGAGRARARRRPVAHHPATDPGGAVPAPLRRPGGAAVTWVLVRRFLRRDRWMFVWWGLGAALLYYSQAVSVKGLYATQAEFDRAARTMESNAAFIAMAGPARALNTVGGQVTWQATAFGALVAGLMSMFLVGRHTRAEEESGRDELLRAAAVERHAPMTAGVVVALLANVLLGLLVALSLISFPLAVADSVALGVGLTLCGWVFTGVALLAAQLTSSTRATYGLTGAVLGLAYVLRAVGDVGYPALTLALTDRVVPGHARLLRGALVAGAAAAGGGRGDPGRGVRRVRTARLRRSACSPAGPARRGRPPGCAAVWAWRGGCTAGPSSAGRSACSSSGWPTGRSARRWVTSSGTARPPATSSRRAGRTWWTASTPPRCSRSRCSRPATRSPPRSGPGPRRRPGGWRSCWRPGCPAAPGSSGTSPSSWQAPWSCCSPAASGLGVGYAGATGDRGAIASYAVETLQYVAPVLLLAGVAALLHGLVPRWASLAWIGLGVAVVVAFFGPLLRLPQGLQDLSPFEHLALVPAEPFAPVAFAGVLVVAVAAGAAAHVALGRRDLR